MQRRTVITRRIIVMMLSNRARVGFLLLAAGSWAAATEVRAAASAAPDLQLPSELLYSKPGVVKPNREFSLNAGIGIAGGVAAHDVVVNVDLPPGTGVKSIPFNCVVLTGRVQCTFAEILPLTQRGYTLMTMTLIAPPKLDPAPITITVTATEREVDPDGANNAATIAIPMYRTFLVTTRADDGGGSLRAAITAANAQCSAERDLCMIAFRIEEPSPERWKTIRILSPLPPIAQYVDVDGISQLLDVGRANLDGPEIEISGGGTTEGDGFTITAFCGAALTYLTINGFRGNGVSIVRPQFDRCPSGVQPGLQYLYIGTDPTGTFAKPNGARGIGMADYIYSYSAVIPISNCVISGNTRSGIFAGAGAVSISTNRIGVKAHSIEPLPNGASGIYLGPYGHSGSSIGGNTIAFNHDFGIAIDPANSNLVLGSNRIWANDNAAIDIGLDGVPTTARQYSGSRLAAPRVTRAQFDAASNTTIVEGDVEISTGPSYGLKWQVEVFSSDTAGARRSGDAQRILGQASGTLNPLAPAQTAHFTFTAAGKHTGEWITATLTSIADFCGDCSFRYMTTSELSAPVQVTP